MRDSIIFNSDGSITYIGEYEKVLADEYNDIQFKSFCADSLDHDLEYIGAPGGTEDYSAKAYVSFSNDFIFDVNWKLIDGKLYNDKPLENMIEVDYETPDNPYPISFEPKNIDEDTVEANIHLSDGTNIKQTFSNKKYELTYDDIYDLCLKSYNSGYNTYEFVGAGLEGYDPGTAIRWILLDLKGKEKI